MSEFFLEDPTLSEEGMDGAIEEMMLAHIREELQNSAPSLANPQRYKEFVWAYGLVKSGLRDAPGIKLSYRINEPFAGYGSVTVTGGFVDIDPKVLSKVGELANSLSVTPKTNGTVEVSFGFNNLAVSKKGGV